MLHRGVLLLTFMVVVAIIGVGALFVIPPVEKEGRAYLEREYENRLRNMYRAFHQYLEYDGSGNTLETGISQMKNASGAPQPLRTYEVLIFLDDDRRKIFDDMVFKGYITDQMSIETIFPDVTGELAWEIVLIPMY